MGKIVRDELRVEESREGLGDGCYRECRERESDREVGEVIMVG